MFVVACAESLAMVGAVVPAAIVMFAAGALIGTGALDLWTTLAAAVGGAVLGDGLSYELGRSREASHPGLAAVPALWPADRAGRSVPAGPRRQEHPAGAFVAPVRAFVPLLAGFGRMPRTRFYSVNVASALLWAPVHILPGVLFGASLHVAEAVSGRLALIVLLLAALAWGVVWLMTTRAAIRRALGPATCATGGGALARARHPGGARGPGAAGSGAAQLPCPAVARPC